MSLSDLDPESPKAVAMITVELCASHLLMSWASTLTWAHCLKAPLHFQLKAEWRPLPHFAKLILRPHPSAFPASLSPSIPGLCFHGPHPG